jgi:nucleoside-diphosphate-sugar epimerase
MPERKFAIIGCGYIGTGVGAALAARGHDVIGTTTTPERRDELKAHGIRPRVLTVQDAQALRDVVRDREVVYLTLAAGGRHRDYREVYLRGAHALLEALEISSAQRVIYTSSTGVYGQEDGSPVNEDSPTEPSTANGKVLVETEKTLLAGCQRSGRQAAILRLAGIIGPDRGPVNRMPSLAGTQRSDGEAWVNLIHRHDAVNILVRLADVSYHGILNVCGDEPIRRRVYYDRLIQKLGLAPIRWTVSNGTSLGKRISNTRVKQLLNYEFEHPCAE